jgi:hypothetical protein
VRIFAHPDVAGTIAACPDLEDLLLEAAQA